MPIQHGHAHESSLGNALTMARFQTCSEERTRVQGTAIEATMWRELADKYHPLLEEGKVYLFSKGKVKPANKNYSAVRNDYTISFDSQ